VTIDREAYRRDPEAWRRQRREEWREAVAYHEAGHAIAGEAVGWTWSHVAVMPHGSQEGLCEGVVKWHGAQFGDDVLGLSPGGRRRNAIVTAAGPVAEARHRAKRTTPRIRCWTDSTGLARIPPMRTSYPWHAG